MKSWLVLLLSALATSAAYAHPLAPALLELREIAPAQYEVLWRTSLTRARGVDVSPRLPADCRASRPGPAQVDKDANPGAEQALGPPSRERREHLARGSGQPAQPPGQLAARREALVLRWTLDCAPQGLAGRQISIAGLAQGRINVIVSLHPLQGEPMQILLDAERDSLRVPQAGAARPVFASYLALGVEHLLFGLDHLLFIAGLVLLLRRWRTLILTVTAFTLGHSLTLALATLGWLRVDQALTEMGIAFSILWLAVEAARNSAQHAPSVLARWPGLIACAFGLLHGLGFAGALAEIGLPHQQIPQALLAFNLGIELGQLLAVAAVLALAALWRRRPLRALQPAPALSLLPAYAMGTLAAYWCLERSSLLFQ